MSLMAANEESDPSAILNGFWVTLLFIIPRIVIQWIPIPPPGARAALRAGPLRGLVNTKGHPPRTKKPIL